ncbi:MAG: DUF6067 family protein, partial [Kiritimatiellae bacterium]|nr:DUF6067 family protein [Kiritimatiellia bacterium]
SFSVEKNKPGTLAVVVNGTAVIETPLTDQDQYHHLVVNFSADGPKRSAGVSLYLDRRLAGQKEGVKLPVRYGRVVVGQLGVGPGTNKVLDNVAIYRRPLARSEITKICYLEGQPELPKLATVPFIAKPPKIDGIFDTGEWDQAAGICGFAQAWTGVPMDVEDTVRLQYDKDCLYFAYHCPPPASIRGNAPAVVSMLKNTRTGFDTDVEADDAFAIQIERPHAGGDMYYLCVNGANTHYDLVQGGCIPGSTEKGIVLHWDPKWITASTLTLDGWKLEGAIPFKDLKMATPQPGQLLHANFTRYWRTTLSGVAQWACGRACGQPGVPNFWAPTAPLRFGEPDGVTAQLERIGNLIQGTLAIRAKLVNAGSKPVKVRAEMTSNSGEIRESKEIEVPANGSVPYEFNGRVAKAETGMVEFRVTDIAGKTPLFVSAHPILRADHPSIYLRKYPSWSLVKFETEFDSLSETPAGELAAEVTVTPVAGGKTVAKSKVKGFDRYAHTFEMSTKEWPVGDYEGRVNLLHGRKMLDTASVKFRVSSLPPWYNNTIGCDDTNKPPFPFTGMQLRGDSEVCVWGRVYRWGDSLLPIQIDVNPAAGIQGLAPASADSRPMPLLRAPMRLTGKAGGAEFATDRLKAAFEWTESLPTRMAGKRAVTNGNLSISADIRMEYDGFCWVKLTFAPVSGTVDIESLAFEEPFAAAFSDVVNAGEYSLVGTGKFPDQLFSKSATLPIWVGNGDAGLQTFVETLATWHVKDMQATLQLLPGKDGGTMRYNLVDQPLTLSKPRTIEFGWTATPVRPKIWRTNLEPARAHRTSYFVWYASPGWQVGDQGWAKSVPYNGGMTSPYYDNNGWMCMQPYMNTDFIPVDSDVEEFGDEWLANKDDRWRGGGGICISYHSKSVRDWIMWRMHELFKRAPYGGWYYDVVSPIASANPYANAGVLLDDGIRAPTKSLLGLRDLTKRLYTLCRHTYADGQAMIHSSGMPNMAFMSFCEILFDGENLNSSINSQQPTYRGIITPERFRAEYMGHNLGPKLWFLGQGRIPIDAARKYGPDVLADQVVGLMLLHDTQVVSAGGWGGIAAENRAVWHCDKAVIRDHEAIRRDDLYSPGYRFLPYWRQNAATGLKDRQFVSWFIRQPI